MRPRSKFAAGEYNQICDRCGKQVKSSETVTDWDGYVVCHDHHDGRHPQDFTTRLPVDNVHTPDASLRPADTFNSPGLKWGLIGSTTDLFWEDVGTDWNDTYTDPEDNL